MPPGWKSLSTCPIVTIVQSSAGEAYAATGVGGTETARLAACHDPEPSLVKPPNCPAWKGIPSHTSALARNTQRRPPAARSGRSAGPCRSPADSRARPGCPEASATPSGRPPPPARFIPSRVGVPRRASARSRRPPLKHRSPACRPSQRKTDGRLRPDCLRRPSCLPACGEGDRSAPWFPHSVRCRGGRPRRTAGRSRKSVKVLVPFPARAAW
jgi:hypothetical protein